MPQAHHLSVVASGSPGVSGTPSAPRAQRKLLWPHQAGDGQPGPACSEERPQGGPAPHCRRPVVRMPVQRVCGRSLMRSSRVPVLQDPRDGPRSLPPSAGRGRRPGRGSCFPCRDSWAGRARASRPVGARPGLRDSSGNGSDLCPPASSAAPQTPQEPWPGPGPLQHGPHGRSAPSSPTVGCSVMSAGL